MDHVNSFPGEYEVAFLGSREPARQGDVLQFLQPVDDAADWSSYFGVLVTANCDLAHRKAGGILTYVPVVPIEVYFSTVAIPAHLSRLVVSFQASLSKLIDQLGLTVRGDRILEMLELGYGVDTILTHLGIEKPSEPEARRQLERLRLSRHVVASLREDDTFRTRICAAVQLRSDLTALETAKSKSTPWQKIQNELTEGLLRSLPGDYLFVGALSDAYAEGYIANLRLLREIGHDEIVITPQEERQVTTPRARRISRLSTLFTHKLVQQMAAVFTDIGLPEEYLDAKRAIISERFDAWSGYCKSL